jgi:hypothetical protein
MRPVSQARPAGSCVAYMSIPLMLGLCVICGYVFNYRIGGVRVEIAEAMVWRGVCNAEMLMQVESCCMLVQLRLARSLIMCCSPDFET